MNGRQLTELEIELAADRQRAQIDQQRYELLFERTRAALASDGFLFTHERGELPIDGRSISAAGQPDGVTNSAPAVPGALPSRTEVAENFSAPRNAVPALDPTKLPHKSESIDERSALGFIPHSRPTRLFGPKNRRAHRLAFYLSLSPQFRRFE